MSAADVASNFFVRRSDLGRPRCEVVKELLVHMNPDTAAAEHVVQSPAGFVSSFKDNIGRFTLVVLQIRLRITVNGDDFICRS